MSPTGTPQEHLSRARRLLRAAEALRVAGEPTDAVGRACYAAFHAGLALLATIGVEPQAHEGVKRQVSLHFVKPGRVPADFVHTLSRMAAWRHDVDYDVAVTFSDEEAASAQHDAERLVEEAERVIAAGWRECRPVERQ